LIEPGSGWLYDNRVRRNIKEENQVLIYEKYDGEVILAAMHYMIDNGVSYVNGEIYPWLDSVSVGKKGEDNAYGMLFINSEACVIYEVSTETYYAIERARSLLGGMHYHRSTKGSLERVKKAYEKYSPEFMTRFKDASPRFNRGVVRNQCNCLGEHKINLYRVKFTRKTRWGEETIQCYEVAETKQQAVQNVKSAFTEVAIRDVILEKSDVWPLQK